jgi:hypothetical protein
VDAVLDAAVLLLLHDLPAQDNAQGMLAIVHLQVVPVFPVLSTNSSGTLSKHFVSGFDVVWHSPDYGGC